MTFILKKKTLNTVEKKIFCTENQFIYKLFILQQFTTIHTVNEIDF